MNRSNTILGIILGLIATAVLAIQVPDVLGAVIGVTIFSTIFYFINKAFSEEYEFLTKVFFAGLALRLAFGIFIYVFELQEFFGGDALTFSYKGGVIHDHWLGLVPAQAPELIRATTMAGPGWGIHYFVAAIYLVFGKNFLAAQSIAAVFGAATAPMVYFCAEKIFQNKRVAKLAAIGVAVFPAFIIWSGQLLKDGLITFLLVLAMIMVLSLQSRFNYFALIILILCLGGIISLRFYIFYMVAVAVAGSFVIGVSNSAGSVVRRGAVLILTGIGLTYMGAVNTATVDFERYGDLDHLQMSRSDQARSADSGYAEDIDVSTTRGALSAVPIGLAYLMLAPFPWEMRTLRQAITLPEVLVWWAMLPLMAIGIWYSVRYKLRAAFPVLLFSAMLTIAYSIFQANVGTAYRQRTQIQVFLFIFIAVGYVFMKEQRENRRLIERARHARLKAAVEAMER